MDLSWTYCYARSRGISGSAGIQNFPRAQTLIQALLSELLNLLFCSFFSMTVKPRQVVHRNAVQGSLFILDSKAFLPRIPVTPPWNSHPLGKRSSPGLRMNPKYLLYWVRSHLSPQHLPILLIHLPQQSAGGQEQ